MSILKELWTSQLEEPEVRSTYQYVIDLKERLQDTCKLAQENLRKAKKSEDQDNPMIVSVALVDAELYDEANQIFDEELLISPSLQAKETVERRECKYYSNP